MPIKGLTDQSDTGRAFPQIGTIRKGAPKEPKRPGKDLDYFRVEFSEGEPTAAARFQELYVDQPRDIDIVLPFNEIDRCWEAWQEAYVAGALIHRCDGEFIQYAVDPNTGEVTARGGRDVETGQPVPCSGQADCKPRGRLRVIVPGLQRLAYLLLVTGSKHDILNISQQLAAIRDLNGGQLAGIPLVMRRRPRMISTPDPDGGKRRRYKKWLVSIEADPRWVAAKIAALGIEAMPALDTAAELALPAGVVDADVTDDDPPLPKSAEGPARAAAEPDCPHCGVPALFHSGPFDDCPSRSVDADPDPDTFTCQVCGQVLTDYQANGKTWTVSELVDIGQSLKDGPATLCGPCLKARKSSKEAANANDEK